MTVRLGIDLSVFYTRTGTYLMPGLDGCCPTVCSSDLWAGRDSLWEQKKLEARKMLKNAAESPASSARFISRRFVVEIFDHQKERCCIFHG
jgi:hypothetical protein